MILSQTQVSCERLRPDRADLSREALPYANRGWSIIPIRHRSVRGKEPACKRLKRWQAERAGEEQPKKWFRRDDLDGLAVICGEISGGLTCRDFYTKSAYEDWCKKPPELAATLPTVRTARGFHVYFRSSFRKIKNLGNGELRGSRLLSSTAVRTPFGLPVHLDQPVATGRLAVC